MLGDKELEKQIFSSYERNIIYSFAYITATILILLFWHAFAEKFFPELQIISWHTIIVHTHFSSSAYLFIFADIILTVLWLFLAYRSFLILQKMNVVYDTDEQYQAQVDIYLAKHQPKLKKHNTKFALLFLTLLMLCLMVGSYITHYYSISLSVVILFGILLLLSCMKKINRSDQK